MSQFLVSHVKTPDEKHEAWQLQVDEMGCISVDTPKWVRDRLKYDVANRKWYWVDVVGIRTNLEIGDFIINNYGRHVILNPTKFLKTYFTVSPDTSETQAQKRIANLVEDIEASAYKRGFEIGKSTQSTVNSESYNEAWQRGYLYGKQEALQSIFEALRSAGLGESQLAGQLTERTGGEEKTVAAKSIDRITGVDEHGQDRSKESDELYQHIRDII